MEKHRDILGCFLKFNDFGLFSFVDIIIRLVIFTFVVLTLHEERVILINDDEESSYIY